MIICLKRISEKCILFNVNVNTSLKLLWALRGLSEGNQALEHWESACALIRYLGTWALGGYSKSTRALGHLRHWGTRPLRALRHAGIWALVHWGTWAFEALYLADSGTHYYLDIHQYSHTKCYWKTELYSRYNFPFRKQ